MAHGYFARHPSAQQGNAVAPAAHKANHSAVAGSGNSTTDNAYNQHIGYGDNRARPIS